MGDKRTATGFTPSRLARWGLCAFVACAAAAYVLAVGSNVLVFEGRFSPDSVVYLDAGRNLAAGRGLTSSAHPLALCLRENCELPVPMTGWAPLYPLLIAITGATGTAHGAAALIVPLVFLAVALVAAFLLMRELFDTPTGLLAVALLMNFAPLRLASSMAWSETISTAFLFLGFYFAARAARTGTHRDLILTGVAAGLACVTRYALAPLAGGVALVFIRPRDLRRSARDVALVAAGYLSAMGPVMGRNWVVDGRLLGPPRPPSWIPLGTAASDMLRVFTANALPEGLLARSVLVVVGCVMLIVGALMLLRRQLLPGVAEALLKERRHLLVVWPSLYMSFLFYCETTMMMDRINDRLSLPALVFWPLVCAALIVALARRNTWYALAVSCALSLAALVPEVPTAGMVLNAKAPRAYDLSKGVARSETIAWLATNAGVEDLIIAEDGSDLPLYLGSIDVAYYLNSHVRNEEITYDRIVEYIRNTGAKYRHVYIAVRQADPQSGEPVQSVSVFFEDIKRGNTAPYPGVRDKASLKDGHVYELAPTDPAEPQTVEPGFPEEHTHYQEG